MRRLLPLVLIGCMLCGQNVTQRATQIATWLVNGKFDEVFQTFSPDLAEKLPLDKLKQDVGSALKQLGALKGVGAPTTRIADAGTTATVPVAFEKLSAMVVIEMDGAGKVNGISIRPAPSAATASQYQPAPYSDPQKLTEQQVKIGEGTEWELPGTLLLPKGVAKAPAVVLVHGSGPHDRDETIGPNKPFRDIAEGLASRGIAVLRYEKRTRAMAAKMAANKKLTVKDETVDDAVAAVALLAGRDGIDQRRVFVLGHSLGGYLLPRILVDSGKAAGGISLAGSTRPFEDLMLEQLEYLGTLPANSSPQAKTQIENMRKQVMAAKELKPGEESGPAILGMPPHYILDLRSYNPGAMAAKAGLPLLILQGERDYQVTMTDFEGWKTALASHKNITFKSYPDLNHLFEEGTGKATPAEYSKPLHVAPKVIDDIAAWVVSIK